MGVVGEVGVAPVGVVLGGEMVGMRLVRVYVATWKTEYTVNGRRARGVWREYSHTRLITAADCQLLAPFGSPFLHSLRYWKFSSCTNWIATC